VLPPSRSGGHYHRIDIDVTPTAHVAGQDEPVGVKLGQPRY
jgi:hypothetical protein